jgi:ribosome biogenesis protein MAK21
VVVQAFFHKFFSRKSEIERVKSARAGKKRGKGDGEDGAEEHDDKDEAGEDADESEVREEIGEEAEDDEEDSDADEAEIWKVKAIVAAKLHFSADGVILIY